MTWILLQMLWRPVTSLIGARSGYHILSRWRLEIWKRVTDFVPAARTIV